MSAVDFGQYAHFFSDIFHTDTVYLFVPSTPEVDSVYGSVDKDGTWQPPVKIAADVQPASASTKSGDLHLEEYGLYDEHTLIAFFDPYVTVTEGYGLSLPGGNMSEPDYRIEEVPQILHMSIMVVATKRENP